MRVNLYRSWACLVLWLIYAVSASAINLGTIPPGKTITVRFQAQVDYSLANDTVTAQSTINFEDSTPAPPATAQSNSVATVISRIDNSVVVSAPPSAALGQPVALTANVSPTSAFPPSIPAYSSVGTLVEYFVNSQSVGQAALNDSGVATLNHTFSTSGVQLVEALVVTNPVYQSSTGGSASITVTANQAPIPTTTIPGILIDEDNSGTLTIVMEDADGDPLTWSIDTLHPPTLGTASIPPTGSIVGVDPLQIENTVTYTPNAEASGSDTFDILVSDGSATTVVMVDVTINPVDDSPIATGDSYSLNAGETLSVTAANGVLSNDNDVDSAALTASLVSGPNHGTLTLNTNGSFDYTHDSGTATSDSFSYRANDGNSNSNIATVSLSITSGNLPPIAIDDNVTLAEDSSIFIRVLDNDRDPEGRLNPASIQEVTPPANGQIDIQIETGQIRYTPRADFHGADQFEYRVDDIEGLSSEPASVVVNVTSVNDTPVAVGDTASVGAGGSAVISLISNDRDRDGTQDIDGATIVITQQPTQGSLQVGQGQVTYTANADASGSDSFMYQVADMQGAGSNSAIVTVNITGNNLLPVATDDSLNVPVDVAGISTVWTNDLDNDGGINTQSTVILEPPLHGTAVVLDTGSIEYTPENGYIGPDTIGYQIQDNEGGYSNIGQVNIQVVNNDTAPRAVDDRLIILFNEPHAANVLGNDHDADGELAPGTLTIVSPPQQGSASVNTQRGFIIYTPGTSFSGEDQLSYRVADNQGVFSNIATLTISDAIGNQPPNFGNLQEIITIVDEDSSESGTISATDPDGDTITWSVSSPPGLGTLSLSATTGSNIDITYTPFANAVGSDAYALTIDDGRGGTDTVPGNVTIRPINDPPEFTLSRSRVELIENFGQTETVSVIAGSVPQDEQAQTVTYSLNPASVDFAAVSINSATGQVGIQSIPDASGEQVFTVTANDGQQQNAIATHSFTLVVVAGNDAPIATDDSYTLEQGGTLSSSSSVLDNDSDPDGDTLTTLLVDGPAFSSVFSLNADGTFSYTHNGSDNFSDSFSYRASDGESSSEVATVLLNIDAVVTNLPPEGEADQYLVEQGQSLLISRNRGVLANDSDPNGDILTVTLLSSVSHGDLLLNDDGSFIYQHDGLSTEQDSFTYQLADRELSAGPINVTIDITPVNNPPQNSTVERWITGVNDVLEIVLDVSDPEGQSLSFVIESHQLPIAPTLQETTIVVPAQGEEGIFAVVVSASDGEEQIEFPLSVEVTQAAALASLEASWVNPPGEVGRRLRLALKASQFFGEALSGATLEVTLPPQVENLGTSNNCSANGASGQVICESALEAGFARTSLIDLEPTSSGFLQVNASLINDQGQVIDEKLAKLTVAEQSISEPSSVIQINDVTVLASGQLFTNPELELAFGTRQGKLILLASVDSQGGVVGDFVAINNSAEQRDIAIGDVTGDGVADLVVIDVLDGANLSVYQGSSNGQFVTLTLPDVPDVSLNQLVLGDLNTDGTQDIIASHPGGLVYINLAAGIVHRLDNSAENYVALANLDGNNIPDLVTDIDVIYDAINAFESGVLSSSSVLAKAAILTQPLAVLPGESKDWVIYKDDSAGVVLMQSSNNQLSPVIQLGANDIESVDVLDLNGDGHLDLLLSQNSEHQAYLNDGTNNFTPRSSLLYFPSEAMLSADVNSDANADLLGFHQQREQVEVFIGSATNLGAIADISADLIYDAATPALRLELANQGPDNVQDIELVFSVPQGLQLQPTDSSADCEFATDTEIFCLASGLAAEEQRQIDFTLGNVPQAGSITVDTRSGAQDKVANNNSDEVSLEAIGNTPVDNKGGGGNIGWLLLCLLASGITLRVGWVSQRRNPPSPRKCL